MMQKDRKIRGVIFFATGLFVLLGTLFVIRLAKGYRPAGGAVLRGTGLLAANSFPKGAEVYINDRLTTATDDTLNLDPGEYQIEIRKDGFHPWKKTLKIQKELVTQTNATLFPTVPSLTPLTFTGALNPVPSPDGNKIVFAVASASASVKNGLYVQDLSSNPLSLNRSPRQIARNTSLYDFANASFTWSPDSSQIIASFENSHLLLDSSRFNDEADFRDVTVRLPAIFQDWEAEIARTERANLIDLPKFMMEVATASATNVFISPESSKLLYQATKSLTIPPALIPPVPAASTQPEARTLEPGAFYVYDIKEDRNFLVKPAPSEEPTESRLVKELIITDILTPLAPAELPSTSSSTVRSITKGKSLEDALREISAQYSSRVVTNIQWYPDGLHLLITSDSGIEIMEYDGNNRVTVFSGSFSPSLVYPWPDGSRIVTLLQFSPDTAPNLYAIKLK